MKKILLGLISAAFGAGCGYFVGYKLAKKKYLAQADKDVQSVIKAYDNYYGVNQKQTEPIEEKKEPENKSLIDKDSIDYDSLKQYKTEVTKYTKVERKPAEVEEKDVAIVEEKKIYLISPDDYNSSEYTAETLVYYSDGVLADDDYNIISNINEVVGPDALNAFGMYEGDAVYVRNDNHEIDYEIILDEREYAEVAPRGIRQEHPNED